MSASYRPVQWNRTKWLYDGVLLAAIVLFILAFLRIAPAFTDPARLVETQILRIRAFGSCAFLMLTLILCIGPLARLDRRFLPLLYNRRHFGVLTALVASTHASFVLDWYFAFSPLQPYVGLLSANTSYRQILGFPFEVFGIFALLVLVVLAVTSHDFWLAFLTPPVWKAMHMSIYVAYLAVIAHVAFGYLQDASHPAFAGLTAGSAALVSALHVLAGRQQARFDADAVPPASAGDGFVRACTLADLAEGHGHIVSLAGRERVAILRYDGKLSAVSNVCAHQNGPLGEGRIIDGCVTCPWHGFQYRAEDGCAPAPFTEKIATYRLRLDGDVVMLDPAANAPGTRVEPIALPTVTS